MNPEDSQSQEPPIRNEMDPISLENERIEEEILKLGASTVGSFLKYKRQARNLTLDEIDLMTHIGPRWTEAIEEGTWSIYPSLLYAKGHIRCYCEALDLPSEFLLAYYSKELIEAFPEEIFHPHPVLQVNQILQDSSSARNNSSSGTSKLLLWLVAGFLLLLVLLGSLKVWMDKTEKRHSLEKANHLTKKPTPSTATGSAPSTGGTLPAPSAVPSTPANVPPPTVPPASSSPSQTTPPSSGSQGPVTPSSDSPNAPHETPAPTAPVNSAQSPESAPAATSAPSVNQPTPKKEQPPLFHKLKVTALKDTSVAVKEGDGRARRYSLLKGKSKVFRSKTDFWISTKDGGAILLSLDGHPLGPAGPENKSVQHKKVVFKKLAN
jgi:cytoskeleton protein RodZ